MRTPIELFYNLGFQSLSLSRSRSYLFLSQLNTKHFESFERLELLRVSASVEGEKNPHQNLKLECEVLRISWNEGCENRVWRTICSQLTAAAPVIYSECVRCIRVALMAKLCPKKITACQDPGSVATAIWHYVQFSPMQTVSVTQSQNDGRRISLLPQRVFLRSFRFILMHLFPLERTTGSNSNKVASAAVSSCQQTPTVKPSSVLTC